MRQKRDVRLVVLGVVLLFFIAGCDDVGDGPGGAPTTPFLGGTQGLVIDFLEGTPPDEVTDTNTFDFQALVSLKNVGEYAFGAVEDIKVSLIGFSPDDFRSDPADFNDSDLKDKNPTEMPTPRKRDSEGNIIEPVETFVEFPKSDANFKFRESIAGNTIFIFRADVCYKYETKVVSEICVLENQVDVASDAICDPTGSKSVFSSGSPVGVTSFRQNVVGTDKLQFSFDVVHSGSGTVFDPAAAANCPKDPTNRRTNVDKVRVTVDTDASTGGLGSLNCVVLDSGADNTEVGTVKLVNGRRTITCTQDLAASRTDFKKPVDINITFNYLDSADKEVLVKHLVDY